MYLRSTKKLSSEVYLEEPIGKDKDDNVVTLQEVLENQEKSIEEVVDLKFKVRKLQEKIQEVLKDFHHEYLAFYQLLGKFLQIVFHLIHT